MEVKAAFIFIGPEINTDEARALIDTPVIKLKVIGVRTYDEAVKAAVALADEGVTAIELCGGFGNIGTGKIARAVKGKAEVGVVRFDHHPGLGHKSGDDVFS
ncbi:DUF6506 family protein [Sporolactobacillus sp. Y61]|jgi:hypothetical protein|uniref:DUF6506 family protein n=1 Tax=Sporolactobacillus sp. Y61 TaxID=3160863 RepID=A0AAU8IDI3_9BACL|nr:DUF6506 family protein [Sporolactobacillus sp. THM19-2]RYL86823.1 hypothetical protein EWH91_13720 [Sporolactobacillus sp. THM19-2]